jgi:hypothetical protein
VNIYDKSIFGNSNETGYAVTVYGLRETADGQYLTANFDEAYATAEIIVEDVECNE